MKDEDKDSYHFVAYLPINGRLYELDGLKEGPVDLGAAPQDSSWMSAMKPILERRMMKYSAEEIHFNLMAVVSDRTMLYQNKLTEARERKANLMDDSEASRIDAEIANYTNLLSQEEEKVNKYRNE